MRSSIARAVLLLVCLPGWSQSAETTLTCKSCHSQEAEQLSASVHDHLNCQDCHRGEATYELAADDAQRYVRRVAGDSLSFEHGDGFSGRPARRDTPALCGDCHADVERMNPYGMRTDQLARYKTSGHGKALFERQDERVAVCVDCHGTPHQILAAEHAQSLTHPLNVPAMCGTCHENRELMGEYDLPFEVVAEYRESVHGRLLLEQNDTGAPTCATCHGNHSAMPPGFGSVGAVCGQCHEHDAKYFAASVHADVEGHKGCVLCHGGGEGRHFHRIERIVNPAGVMIERYAHLLDDDPDPTPERIRSAIQPNRKQIITQALPVCTECHEDIGDDENLPKMFALLDEISAAEQHYVETGRRLDEIGRGVLLVDNARFKFGDAKTHLIALAPLQHTIDNSLVAEKVAELNAICDDVNAELDRLEAGLGLRYRLLIPIWVFALGFSAVLYVKFKKLKAAHVEPAGGPARVSATAGEKDYPTRRTFLDWLVGLGSTAVGAAMAVPAVLYLWPAAKGGEADKVEVAGSADMKPGQSAMIQVGGKPVIVIRAREGFRAFSAVCTHLGCLVKWDPVGREFLCPCHAAVFDEDGGVVSGPPPSPLPEYKVTEAGDQVFVSVA